MALSRTYYAAATLGYYYSSSSCLLNNVTMKGSLGRRVMCSATDGTRYPYEPQQVCIYVSMYGLVPLSQHICI